MRKPTRRIRFTKKVLEGLKPPTSGRTTVYDTLVRDLGLRIDFSGRKSFFWLRKIQGRPVFKAIGAFPASSIEQARGRAHELSGDLDKLKRTNFEGRNPFEHSISQPMFGELLDLYIEKRVKQHATHPKKAAAAVNWMVGKYLAHWRGRKLSAIRGEDVRDLHTRIGAEHGRIIADRCAQLVRRVYYWAIKKEKVWTGQNPGSDVVFFGDKKRERFLRSDELARLFTVLRDEANSDLKDFVLLSLFCGSVSPIRYQCNGVISRSMITAGMCQSLKAASRTCCRWFQKPCRFYANERRGRMEVRTFSRRTVARATS